MRPHCERHRPAAVAKTNGLASLCYAFSFAAGLEVHGVMSSRGVSAVALGALLIAALAGAQTEPKKPAVPPPKKAAAPSTSEEQIPPVAPDALFPAVVARVNGHAILGRDLEQRIQTQLA